MLDASVFIQAARNHYAFDIAPCFWEKLVEKAREGILFSITQVKAEIERGHDDLAEWIRRDFSSYFRRTDHKVLQAYGRIMQWAETQAQYTPSARRELAEAENADAWLIAYALAHNCIVVTEEHYAPSAKKSIPIPNICEAQNVVWVNTVQMLRQLGIKLCGT